MRGRGWNDVAATTDQLAGAGHRFGAPLDLEFAEDFPVVPFHRVQGEEEPLADLVVRESLAIRRRTSNSRWLNGSIKRLWRVRG